MSVAEEDPRAVAIKIAVVLPALLLVIGLVMVLVAMKSDCAARGGVLVTGIARFHCVAPLERQP